MPPSPSGALLSALSGSRSGSTCASSERAGPMNASSCSGDVSRMSERNACASGPNGRPSPPISMQLPARTLAPASLARSAASSTSRVLPTPASPLRSTTAGSPRDRSVERRCQRRQLGVSADEHRTDESASHRAHVLSLRRGHLGEHRQTRRHTRRGTTAIWTRRTRLHPRAYRHCDARVARCGAHPGGRGARVRRLLCSPVTRSRPSGLATRSERRSRRPHAGRMEEACGRGRRRPRLDGADDDGLLAAVGSSAAAISPRLARRLPLLPRAAAVRTLGWCSYSARSLGLADRDRKPGRAHGSRAGGVRAWRALAELDDHHAG